MVRLALAFLLCLCAGPALAAPGMLVEAEFALPEVHVHAQASYRLRFLHATDVQDVELSGPAPRLADLVPIGATQVYETQRHGRRYRAHERRYAVFPFASGTLEMSGAHIRGSVPDASRPGGRRAVRLEAPVQRLTVLPIDIQADGRPWLPADAVTLTERWEARGGGVHHRTLRIEAIGVRAAQLPELGVEVNGMGVLPGPPRLEDRIDGERNLAVREQTFTILPVGSGVFAVPPLQLHWWRADTDTGAVAGLPGRTLVVGEAEIAATAGRRPPVARLALGHLSVVAAAALGLLLLLLIPRRRLLRNAWRLRRACRRADARDVRDGLLEWAELTQADPPRTLGALAARIDAAPVRDALERLERHLYGPDGEVPQSAWLFALAAGVRRAKRQPGS